MCGVCGHASGTRHIATERMLGLGGSFEYFECGQCGCVQLVTPPADLAPYYPKTYYSFNEPELPDLLPAPGWRQAVFRARNQAQFFGRHAADPAGAPARRFGLSAGLGALLARWRARTDFAWVEPLLHHTTVRRLDARILDVGCGSGRLLKQLRQAGFTRLVGCDPFLAAPIAVAPELTIHNCAIDALADQDAATQGTARPAGFDLVMFHHSLEHMAEPIAPLRAAAALLAPHGRCLVAVPVASSEAWRTYGIDWIELDPPRHFFLHTTKSFAAAAAAAGLRVTHIQQDGGWFEFWGSELYRRGLTLMTPDGHVRNPRDLFTSKELAAFEQRTARANAEGVGGRVVFICAPAADQPQAAESSMLRGLSA